MTVQSTPGPWRVSPLEVGGFKIHPANNPDFKICRIENSITYLMAFDEAAEPDAHLIAAAPEMLAALELADEAIIHLDGELSCQATLRAIRAAVAKATGKSRETPS